MPASARKRCVIARNWVVGWLLFMAGALDAREPQMLQYRIAAAPECQQEMVDAHVRRQFALYGPRSKDREYFGFIMAFEGGIGSAIAEGRSCPHSNSCGVDTAKAALLIPPGASVLGEWHTHPESSKVGLLSADDLRGARSNRHIRCYAAYYSQPDGDIYAWNPVLATVPAAMASAALIGNYRRELSAGSQFAGSVEPHSAAIIAAHENPGTQCLSTNTNVHTAATTKKCCRRSTTSRLRSAPAAERRGSRSSCPRPSSG